MRVFYFIGLLALAFGSSFMASADDMVPLDASMGSEQESASSMTWPMLPGESVNDLARMFYPNSGAMQQQFAAKTLPLNADTQPHLKATAKFEAPTLLVIPTLKSLSKSAVKSSKKSDKQTLKMSYGLKRLVQLAPEALQKEYEELVNKNAFLKEQLAKLNERILELQAKLDDLKLIFDKTLTLPNPDSASVKRPPTNQNNVAAQVETTGSAATQSPTKKVFKNLNKDINQTRLAEPTLVKSEKGAFIDSLSMDLVKPMLAIIALLLIGTFVLKKYRGHMFEKLSFTASKIQNTVTDFSGYFEKTSLPKEVSPEVVQQQQAAKEVETRLSSTLEEARLLMSVNRGTDAIAHLKMTIESQPKASINHWLYLLEVFRKLNLKDEFEAFAERMHLTFNVMTPVWYEKEAAVNTAMVVPQSLEEFPHIMEQLYGVWPGELATVYLRSLIADNRGGERSGFGKAVVSEILMLIALLDARNELPI
jgi:hypothetical protein